MEWIAGAQLKSKVCQLCYSKAIDVTPAYTEDECDALLGLIRNQFGKLSVRYWVTVPGDSADSA